MPPANRTQPKRAASSESRYSLVEFMAEYPDDEACLVALWSERYSPDGEHAYCPSPSCKTERTFKRYATTQQRQSWTCTTCGHHLHPTAGTIFHKSSTSLRQWFYCMYLMTSTRCGISAKQVERELGCAYKTALRMMRLIRTELMNEDDPFKVLVASPAAEASRRSATWLGHLLEQPVPCTALRNRDLDGLALLGGAALRRFLLAHAPPRVDRTRAMDEAKNRGRIATLLVLATLNYCLAAALAAVAVGLAIVLWAVFEGGDLPRRRRLSLKIFGIGVARASSWCRLMVGLVLAVFRIPLQRRRLERRVLAETGAHLARARRAPARAQPPRGPGHRRRPPRAAVRDRRRPRAELLRRRHASQAHDRRRSRPASWRSSPATSWRRSSPTRSAAPAAGTWRSRAGRSRSPARAIAAQRLRQPALARARVAPHASSPSGSRPGRCAGRHASATRPRSGSRATRRRSSARSSSSTRTEPGRPGEPLDRAAVGRVPGAGAGRVVVTGDASPRRGAPARRAHRPPPRARAASAPRHRARSDGTPAHDRRPDATASVSAQGKPARSPCSARRRGASRSRAARRPSTRHLGPTGPSPSASTNGRRSIGVLDCERS